MTEARRGEWIQTASGIQFWPLDPRPEEVRIEDIAHSLARQCRFAGHLQVDHYSVAEHSVRVSYACDPEDALWGCLHDSSEAYLVDIPRPLKQCPEFAFYREAEHRMMQTICKRFGLVPTEPESVRRADAVLLSTEKRDLMGPTPAPWSLAQGRPAEPLPGLIVPLNVRDAEIQFLQRFYELMRHAQQPLCVDRLH
jgi:5'-nucleotidase